MSCAIQKWCVEIGAFILNWCDPIVGIAVARGMAKIVVTAISFQNLNWRDPIVGIAVAREMAKIVATIICFPNANNGNVSRDPKTVRRNRSL